MALPIPRNLRRSPWPPPRALSDSVSRLVQLLTVTSIYARVSLESSDAHCVQYVDNPNSRYDSAGGCRSYAGHSPCREWRYRASTDTFRPSRRSAQLDLASQTACALLPEPVSYLQVILIQSHDSLHKQLRVDVRDRTVDHLLCYCSSFGVQWNISVNIKRGERLHVLTYWMESTFLAAVRPHLRKTSGILDLYSWCHWCHDLEVRTSELPSSRH